MSLTELLLVLFALAVLLVMYGLTFNVGGKPITILYYHSGKCCLISKPTLTYQCWNSSFFDCIKQVGRLWITVGR